MISKPRSNSSSSNLLEISSPFIIVFFFNTSQIVMSIYISGSINRFHLPSQSLCIWQVLTVGSRQIQLSAFASYLPKNIIYPEILFALKYHLPKSIIFTEILFAQKYCLSRNIIHPETLFAQKYYLSRNIFFSAISFVQKYHLLRNNISSVLIFVRK